MSRFDRISDRATVLSDRAMGFAGDVGDRLRHAIPDDMGQRLRGAIPSRAGGLLETGVALGAMRTGAKVAGGFARRHPAALAAAVAGAGLLWYAAHRRKQQAHAPGNTYAGSARRLDGNGNASSEGSPHVRQAPVDR